MANSLYQQMVKSQSNSLPQGQVNNMQQMAQMMKSNPQQMLDQMVQSNPQASMMMKMVKNSGMSPKQMFFNLAKQKGVDPTSILNMLK